MSIVTTKCEACGSALFKDKCDECGIDLTGMDDAVEISVKLIGGAPAAPLKHYCAPCARKVMPEAVGADTDLPAVDGQAGTFPSAPVPPVE